MGSSGRTSGAVLSRRLRFGWFARAAWWLIPILGVLLVLSLAYSAFTYTQYPRSNGNAGDLLPGASAGQTFVSRFSGLSGIEVRVGKVGARAASLVLHLRDKPGDANDLTTATIPAGTSIRPGEWVRFSFPPLPDTRDRSFYFQVESPDGTAGSAFALSWWQVAEAGNPYNDGAAYRNGRREHADLAFGLHYSPSPIEFYGQVLATAIQSPPGVLLLALALSMLGAWTALLYALPRMTKDRSLISKEKLLAWSLPFVLAVALSNGLIYLCTVPPWQGPDEPSHFAYVALLDHYALDYRLVEALAIPGAGKQEQDLVRAVNASLDRNNFTRYLIGYPTPGSAANLGESLWWEVHQPATYYWVCAAVLRSARTLGIAPDPYVDPAGALLWVRGTSLVLSLGVVALAWLGGLLLGGRRDPWLRVLLPITVALLPMHAFIASTANNDIAAELVCSALFVTLVALFRWPHGRRGIGLAALCLALSFATRYTKDSAYQVLPVVGLGLLAWLGPAISSFGRGRAVKWLGAGRARWGLKFPALLMLIVLLLVAGVLLSAFERQNFAAGWDIRYAPFTRAARVASQTAHGGNYVIQTGSFSQPIVAEQMLAPGTPQTFKATFSGWARLASPALPGSTRAQLAIQREDKDLGSASAYLDPSGAWTPLTATANIPKGSTPVYLALLAYGAGSLVQYDDLSLHVEWTGPVWDDPAFPLTILNPSGEQGVLALRPGIASLLPFTARQMIDTAVNPQPFSKKQLTAYYASNEFTSFWGDFGWLSLPLPDSIYALLEVVCAAALLGIIVRLVRSWGSWTWQEWLGLATITGLAMGTAGVYLIQITVLANQHLFAFPQGRYLFVAIIPLMWLLLYGMHSAWVGAVWAALRVRRFVAAGSRATASRNESVPEEAPASASRPWAAWLWLNALWLFAAYCLLALVGPYFHS